MIVVPSLERRLVDARLEQLSSLGVPLARKLPEDTLLWQDRVESYQVETNARVVAFGVLSKNRQALSVVADSRTKSSRDVQNDPVALAALASGDLEQKWVVVAGVDYAEVAVPVRPETVVLFQAALADSLATVQIVRERLLLATAFALVLALILGLTAAGMLSHRLLRLESAAERIAGGDFGAPIVDHGNDEIGELARAFDRMRVQLAQLDNARKEFVANASHELRTRCSRSEAFWSSWLDEDIDEETRRGFIETMQGQVQRLARLSTDLLDLSRVDAGQLTVVLEPVDLGGVVEMLAGEIGHLAASTGHELRTAIDDDVWCLGDDARILQIGPCARDQRDDAHPGRDDGDLASAPQGRSRRAVGRRRRSGDSRDTAGSRLRAVLPRRGCEWHPAAGSVSPSPARSRESWAEMSGSTPRGNPRVSRSTFPRSRSHRALRAARGRFHVKTRRRRPNASPRASPPHPSTICSCPAPPTSAT